MAMMATKDQNSVTTVTFLEVKAKRIRELSAVWAGNALDLGDEFIQAKTAFKPTPRASGQGGVELRNDAGQTWGEWCQQDAGWDETHVGRFISVTQRFRGKKLDAPIRRLQLPMEVLRVMALAKTKDAANAEIVNRAEAGERITGVKAREIAEKHFPTRAEAIKQAKETGKLVAARDGNMYSGASEDEIAAYSERRSSVFSIERAITVIALCEHTPRQLITMAEEHWISDWSLVRIEDAIAFLDALKPLLAKRQKVVS